MSEIKINLPSTSFPMKANLPAKEPEIIKFWEEINLYQELRSKSKGRDKFILHDGPPYANGHIHIGTALNKILKDIVVRFNQMMGKDAPYVPGWDCHGLPIEWKVEEEYKKKGKNKNNMNKVFFKLIIIFNFVKQVSIFECFFRHDVARINAQTQQIDDGRASTLSSSQLLPAKYSRQKPTLTTTARRVWKIESVMVVSPKGENGRKEQQAPHRSAVTEPGMPRNRLRRAAGIAPWRG